MNKKSSYLLGIISTIIIGCVLQFFLCCKNCKDTCQAKKESKTTTNVIVEKPVIKPVSKNGFNISDNSSGLAFKADNNFNFLRDNFNIKDSMSSNMNNQIDKLAVYFNDNSNKRLNIEGLYNSNEINNSVFPNLGYARANNIKNYFVSKGMSSKQMNLSGRLDDNFISDSLNVFHGPVNFTISALKDIDNNKEYLKKLKDSLIAKPLILHFKTGSNKLTLSNVQRQKIADLVTYVEKSDDGKLIVTGHSDNTGLRDNNIALSFERADFVKNILNENGISETYMTTDSKGPDEPIADNTTKEGRAENRRVTVTIN
jgi:outer membrane protein OmpA-like peptidoglycan-associated protein